ncbi:hypothetical protein CWO85_01400 [Candidatus Phytoplasma ziziphi]|uniref:Uncharacterized protein n=1 Tax=Ziziphus jujuba witches'-broom phytoplasma TaxID=135727 RepID=A0A660HMD2_ZIZJU|nr:hypothetical protein [Candidatus Phytoplasma ziziphi]AYJ01184.1 hypothetical protein CWO85_01400 [Candidatus Phytoplasma ziziphi]
MHKIQKKNLVIIVLVLLIIVSLVFVGIKLMNPQSSQEKSFSDTTQSLNGSEKQDENIEEVMIEVGDPKDMKTKIKEFIRNKIHNEDFNLLTYDVSVPSYNPIDKTITGTNSRGPIIQSGGFCCPIKDPSPDLLAVYFDGGGKAWSR